jgi:hypothetical protein
MGCGLPLMKGSLIREKAPLNGILFAHRWVNAQFLQQPVST